ncbi:MAG: trehalose-6-phosphate synthase, partial [Alphaproteobacteria bacterium]
EYVAARTDNWGVLVLSEFTGSAKELRAALLVNPHDIDALSAAIETALEMPQSEQERRLKSLRRTIKRNDVYHWARSFLDALAA